MAALTLTAADVKYVRKTGDTVVSGAVNVACTRGQYFRMNTSTGLWEPGNATTAAEAAFGGICLDSVAANENVDFLVYGMLELGTAMDSLNFGSLVYLSDTDGTLDGGSAGTVTRIIGTVMAAPTFTTVNRVLMVNIDPSVLPA